MHLLQGLPDVLSMGCSAIFGSYFACSDVIAACDGMHRISPLAQVSGWGLSCMCLLASCTEQTDIWVAAANGDLRGR